MDEISKQVIGFISTVNERYVSIFILLLAIFVFICFVKILNNKFTKHKLSKENIGISKYLRSFRNSNDIAMKDFLLLPEAFRTENIKLFNILLRSGIFLMFSGSDLKNYFGEYINIDPKQDNVMESNGLRVTVKEILIISKKLTRMNIEVTNISSNPIAFKMGVSSKSLKNWIELKINNKRQIKVEDVNQKEFFSKGELLPNDNIILQIVFESLERPVIRKINKVKFKVSFKKSKQSEYEEYSFLLPIDRNDIFDINGVITKQVDFHTFLTVFSFGGFFILSIPIILIILLICTLLGGVFVILSIIISILLLILTINLNTKFAQIVYDYFKQEN